ncbi:MAG: hypothetical protein ACTHQ3_12730 [Motilibacteraceae bacterium]
MSRRPRLHDGLDADDITTPAVRSTFWRWWHRTPVRVRRERRLDLLDRLLEADTAVSLTVSSAGQAFGWLAYAWDHAGETDRQLMHGEVARLRRVLIERVEAGANRAHQRIEQQAAGRGWGW